MRFTKAVHFAAAVAVATTAAVVGLVQPASAAPVITYTGPMFNLLTWEAGKTKAMAVLNASTGNTAPMIQAPYSDPPPNNDRIILERESQSGVYRLKPQHTYTNDGNVHNDKCLAVKNADSGNNIPIVNATCSYDDTNNDVWLREQYEIDGGLVVWWRNQMTRKCITTKNASTDNAALITFDCNGGHNGFWFYG